MWALHVQFEGSTVELFADEVDFAHFPMIWVSKIRQERRSGLIELPESEAYKKLAAYKRVAFNFSQIGFAGEVDDERGSVLKAVTTDERGGPKAVCEES